MRLPSRYRLRLATSVFKIIQSWLNDSSLQLKPTNLSIWQQFKYKNPKPTRVSQSNPEVCFLPSPLGTGHLFVHKMWRSPNLRPRLPTLARHPVLLSSGNDGGSEPARSPMQSWRQALSGWAQNQEQGRATTGDRAAGWRGPAETEAGVTVMARALSQGLSAGEEDRREKGGHTWRRPSATGSCVSTASVRGFQHSPPPLLPAQGLLHVPLQRGSRRPAQPTS